jgi:DNA-binding NarL/FixJ family response regulator
MPRAALPEGRRVLVLAHEPTVAQSVESSLAPMGFRLAVAHSAQEAERHLALPLNLLLVDLEMPDVDAIDFVRRMAKRLPSMPVIAMCARCDDARIIAAVRAGARGCLFVADISERLPSAVQEALDGGRPMSRGMARLLFEHVRDSRRISSQQGMAVRPLTKRECVVLEQLGRSLNYEEIGEILGISVNTVRTFVRTIYDKLDVNSRTEAVLIGIKLGLVKGSPQRGQQQ